MSHRVSTDVPLAPTKSKRKRSRRRSRSKGKTELGHETSPPSSPPRGALPKPNREALQHRGGEQERTTAMQASPSRAGPLGASVPVLPSAMSGHASPCRHTAATTAATLAAPQGLSLWSFLGAEVMPSEGDTAYRRGAGMQREVSNLLIVPWNLEKLLLFGFVICLDSFLFLFTLLPMRLLFGIRPFVQRVLMRGSHRRWPLLFDAATAITLLVCISLLLLVDTAVIYHHIKGQATIKLYVIFNVLEVFDHLLCSFGQDVFDSLYWNLQAPFGLASAPRATFNFALCLVYAVIHSILLFYQVVTLNVAVNYHSNALLVLLISNNIVELKGRMFKRYFPENMFQISCSDMVERFRGCIFLIVITVQNFSDLHWHITPYWFHYTASYIVMIAGTEVVVDWIKHAFVCKFNRISASWYGRFAAILTFDILGDDPAVAGSLRGNQSSGSQAGDLDGSPMKRSASQPDLQGLDATAAGASDAQGRGSDGATDADPSDGPPPPAAAMRSRREAKKPGKASYIRRSSRVSFFDSSYSVVRRIGFVPIPLAALLVRVAIKVMPWGGVSGWFAWLSLGFCVIVLKVVTRVNLIGFSLRTAAKHSEDPYIQTLEPTQRYELVKGRMG